MHGELSDMPLWMAGQTGQAALALSGTAAGLRAAVDQHEAEVRDALNGPITAGVLMSYARGFVEAAVARGWWLPSRSADGAGPLDAPLDWQSLRLAAVCRLFLEAQGLAL